MQCKSDEISQVNRAKLAIEIKSIRYILKGHSHLWDRADLDASFLTLTKSLPQPEIKVHLVFRFNLRSVLLSFQSFPEKPVFECALMLIL